MSNRPTEPLALDRTFTYRLHVLSKLTDRQTQLRHEVEVGIPAHEARCLSVIGNFSPLSVKDLAQAANLDKAQASRATQALVDKGLTLKQPSPTDGRGVVLTLTPQGHTLYQQVMQVVHARNTEIASCLNPEEQQMFGALLDRLVQSARLDGGAKSGA